MKSKISVIVGRVLSGLVGIMLMGPSALGKFLDWEGKTEAFAKSGFTTDLMFKIGILEVIIAGLYLIPQTAFIGAILVTGYLGGATVTHLRVGEPFLFPPILGVIMWVGLALRRPEIFALAMGKRVGSNEAAEPMNNGDAA